MYRVYGCIGVPQPMLMYLQVLGCSPTQSEIRVLFGSLGVLIFFHRLWL